MTKVKLLSAVAILSTVIATPVLAQEAVQEPGMQAFTRVWVLDPKQAGQRALWRRHVTAVRLRARQRNIMRARQRSITLALTSCDKAADGQARPTLPVLQPSRYFPWL
jgi:transposase